MLAAGIDSHITFPLPIFVIIFRVRSFGSVDSKCLLSGAARISVTGEGKDKWREKKNSREDWKKEKREEGKLIYQMSRLTRPVARIFCAGCVP